MESNPLQGPQQIADAISELLDLPFGKKPFRTVVDFMGLKEPIERYNKALHKATKELYVANGIENLLSLNKK